MMYKGSARLLVDIQRINHHFEITKEISNMEALKG